MHLAVVIESQAVCVCLGVAAGAVWKLPPRLVWVGRRLRDESGVGCHRCWSHGKFTSSCMRRLNPQISSLPCFCVSVSAGGSEKQQICRLQRALLIFLTWMLNEEQPCKPTQRNTLFYWPFMWEIVRWKVFLKKSENTESVNLTAIHLSVTLSNTITIINNCCITHYVMVINYAFKGTAIIDYCIVYLSIVNGKVYI